MMVDGYLYDWNEGGQLCMGLIGHWLLIVIPQRWKLYHISFFSFAVELEVVEAGDRLKHFCMHTILLYEL